MPIPYSSPGGPLSRRTAISLLATAPLSMLATVGCGGSTAGSGLNTPLRVRWSVSPARAQESFQRYVAAGTMGTAGTVYAFAGPKSEGGRAYGALDTVYALDSVTGRVRWRFGMEAGTRHSATRAQSGLVTRESEARVPLFYASDRTVVVQLRALTPSPSNPGLPRYGKFTLFGLDAATGAQRWAIDSVDGDCEQVGNLLALVDSSAPREIRLLDPDTGTMVQRIAWTGEGDITELDGLPDAILAFDTRRLVCFNIPQGTERWSITSDASSPYFYDVTGRDTICTAPGQTSIFAVLAGASSPSPLNTLVRLDPQSGRELWRSGIAPTQGFYDDLRLAIAADGSALLWNRGPGSLHVIDPTTGQQRWTYSLGNPSPTGRTGQGVSTSPVSGGTVYSVRSTWQSLDVLQSSELAALDLRTGQERWRVLSRERELHSPPALTADGGLVFLEGDNVVCLDGQ